MRLAVECFSEARGLDRSLEIAADLTHLNTTEQPGESAPGVSPAAAAYAAYLSRICEGSSESLERSDREAACLK